MIFVTVGMQLPFDRLMRAVDHWSESRGRGSEVFAQTCKLSHNNYTPRTFEHVEEVGSEEFTRRLKEARVVVSHAGMGTIISSLMLSKPILLLPRRASFGEQRNDHQLATVGRFADRPGVHVSLTENDLASQLDAIIDRAAVDRDAPLPYAQDCLIWEVRRQIFGLPAATEVREISRVSRQQ